MFNYLNSQDLKLYEKESFVFENDTLNYRILKPLNYNSNKQYPVLLFLHGAGERGDDNSSQLNHGGRLFLDTYNRKKYNSWIIFPQCSVDDRWANLVNDDFIDRLSGVCESNVGDCFLRLVLVDEDENIFLELASSVYKVEVTNEFINGLNKLPELEMKFN